MKFNIIVWIINIILHKKHYKNVLLCTNWPKTFINLQLYIINDIIFPWYMTNIKIIFLQE